MIDIWLAGVVLAYALTCSVPRVGTPNEWLMEIIVSVLWPIFLPISAWFVGRALIRKMRKLS